MPRKNNKPSCHFSIITGSDFCPGYAEELTDLKMDRGGQSNTCLKCSKCKWLYKNIENVKGEPLWKNALRS